MEPMRTRKYILFILFSIFISACGGGDRNQVSYQNNNTTPQDTAPAPSEPAPTPSDPAPTPSDPAPAPTSGTLTINIIGSGSVSLSNGNSCANDCTLSITGDITAGATPSAGYVFQGWSGACTGTQNCSLTASSDQTLNATFSAAANTGVDQSKYVNLAGLAYGRSPSYSQSECVQMSNKFDVILEGIECRATIKNTDPTDILLAYTNSSNCTEGDPLCTFLESQPNPEDHFLNYTEPSVQEIDGSTFNRRTGDRVCTYGWGCADNGNGTRWQTDYVSASARDLLVSYYSDRSNLPPNTDGWFFDNMDRGCAYSGNVASGAIEYGAAPFSLSEFQPMEDACNALKSAMNAGIPQDLYFIDNISNWGLTYCNSGWGWRACSNQYNGMALSRTYADAVLKTRGTLQEFEYRMTTPLAELDDNYGGLKEIWEAKGRPNNNLFIMWWVSAGVSGIPSNSDRIKIYALGTHLEYQFARSFMRYDGADTNSAPLTGDWFEAMAAPIGNAINERYSVDARTYRRDFENGLVLVRHIVNWDDNYTDSASYNLGDTYYPVHADGTYGAPVTSVTLRNGEAFIGVKSTTFN
jgi:uncharacterized repeat protein (TIGR02543 family)